MKKIVFIMTSVFLVVVTVLSFECISIIRSIRFVMNN